MIVEGLSASRRPTCTFRHVYPDGDVHWFNGSRQLSEHRTTKRVEEGGWLTVVSYLERDSSDMPYNCSLRSTKSGRYIASALVPSHKRSVMEAYALSTVPNNRVTSLMTGLYITVLLAVTL